MSAHPYLSEMPAAPCPEGCVVRRGDRLGSVTHNRDGRWAVTEHGARNGRIGLSHGGSGTPEAAGWRHALDRRLGLYHVWSETIRTAVGFHALCDEFGSNMGTREESIDRSVFLGKFDDGDLCKVARAFAAAIR